MNLKSNAKYWEQREAEALKHRITDEKQYDKKLKEIYSNMLDACQSDINSFYGRYADKNGITIAEAKKRVKQADIAAYERKAKKYVEEKNFTKQANEEMALYNLTMKVNRLEMLKANIGLELLAGHSELEQFMSGILQDRTEDELKRQAGILGKTVQNNAKTANAIVNASFHNATFSDRVWLYQDLLKDELDKLLQSGLIQGKNPRVLARELEKTFGASRFNAERLMRTELARVQTEAQKQSFIKNGFEMYTFHTNTGCCDVCAAINGKHYKIKDMQIGENAPPMHPHCRCSTSAYEDSEEYERWLNFLAKGGTTEEYNKLKATKSWQPDFSDYEINKMRNALLSDGSYSVEDIGAMDEATLQNAMADIWKSAANKADKFRSNYTIPENYTPLELSEWLRRLPTDAIPNTLNVQSPFQRYSLLNLYGDLPEIVDDISAKDGIMMYRGVKDTQSIKGTTICEMTKYDPNGFVGSGIMGDGLYFTTAKAGTERYGDSSIVAKLKPSAKILELEDANSAMIADGNIGADLSVWAAEQGYDAIRVKVGWTEKDEYYYTVLRRNALWIKR